MKMRETREWGERSRRIFVEKRVHDTHELVTPHTTPSSFPSRTPMDVRVLRLFQLRRSTRRMTNVEVCLEDDSSVGIRPDNDKCRNELCRKFSNGDTSIDFFPRSSKKYRNSIRIADKFGTFDNDRSVPSHFSSYLFFLQSSLI